MDRFKSILAAALTFLGMAVPSLHVVIADAGGDTAVIAAFIVIWKLVEGGIDWAHGNLPSS